MSENKIVIDINHIIRERILELVNQVEVPTTTREYRQGFEDAKWEIYHLINKLKIKL